MTDTDDAVAMLLEYSPILTRLQNDALAVADPRLTLRQHRILRRIDQGHRSLSAIRRLASTSLATISESVDTLVTRGLVTRQKDPDDGRRARLELTPKGKRALTQSEACLRELHQELALTLDRAPKGMPDAVRRAGEFAIRQLDDPRRAQTSPRKSVPPVQIELG